MDKKFFVPLFLLFIFFNAGAASIMADKNDFAKGDEIVFRGELQNSDVVIAKNGPRIVFEKNIFADSNGAFELAYKSGFLDPAGEWVVSLKDGNASAKINVAATQESSVFLVKFGSPIPQEYKRTEDLEISLKITYLGKPVDSAEAAVWGIDGKKLFLENKGGGNYGLYYEIPYNADLGDWEFFALAEKDANGSILGGENSIHLGIAKSKIAIEIIEPVLADVGIEQSIPIIVKPAYSNGKSGENIAVFGKILDSNIIFSKQANGSFSGSYTTTEKDLGELVMELSAIDDAGNAGETKVNLIVGGWPAWFAKKNWIFFAVAAIILVFVLVKSSSKIRKSIVAASLKREREAEFAKLKKLQKDYFEAQAIDRKTFEERSAELEGNIAQIDEKACILGKMKK